MLQRSIGYFIHVWGVVKMWSSYLRSKVFNVGLLLLQGGLGDEHGEVAVLHTKFLNLPVEEFFNGLPDGERPGPQHIAATDVIVLNHFCFSNDLEGQQYMDRNLQIKIYLCSDFYWLS